jgi:hypothetical protein
MLKPHGLPSSLFLGSFFRIAALVLGVCILAVPGYALNVTTISMTSGPAGNTPYGSQAAYVATVSVPGNPGVTVTGPG